MHGQGEMCVCTEIPCRMNLSKKRCENQQYSLHCVMSFVIYIMYCTDIDMLYIH